MAVACALLLAGALPARAAWMLPPAPYRAKDFTMVKKDGVYHLFYIRHNVTLPEAQTEIDFGHATSRDLFNWTQQPAVLPVAPDRWENSHIWAPSITLRDGVYYMFYCGVTDQAGVASQWQRIGVATSTNLYDWNRLDHPVYTCESVPWSFCQPLNPISGFRDPFVMDDPSTPGSWLMWYAANVGTDTTNMVAGRARSSGDPAAWTDAGPDWITYRAPAGGGRVESPHVFDHGGLWFLFFTVSGTQPIMFATSPNLFANVSGWTLRGSIGGMLGAFTGAWFASEYFRDGLNDYLMYVNADRVETSRMVWNGPTTFVLTQPDPFHVTNLAWEADTVTTPNTASLRTVAVNGFNRLVPIETLVLDAQGVPVLVPPDSLGLGSYLAVPTDTTRTVWNARLWPTGRTSPMRLLVRTQDLTAITPQPIVVLPAPIPFRVTHLSWSADTLVRDGPAILSVAATSWTGHRVALEALTSGPGGLVHVGAMSALGLPDTLALVADITTVNWAARTWPDTTTLTSVAVRVVGDTMTTVPALVVLPKPGPPPKSPVLGPPPDDGGGLIIRVLRSATRRSSEILIDVAAPGPLRVELFDTAGRRLARLADRVFERGAHVIAWDGRGDDGRAAPPGLFFVRASGPHGARVARLLRLP